MHRPPAIFPAFHRDTGHVAVGKSETDIAAALGALRREVQQHRG